MAITVFISYSSPDESKAKQIARTLSKIDVNYFFDRKDISWGDDITQQIADGLKKCSALIVIISPASIKSQWVPFEIGQARALGVKILPFLTHPSLDLPGYLHNCHYKTQLADIKKYMIDNFKGVFAYSDKTDSQTKSESTETNKGDVNVEAFFWLGQTFATYVISQLSVSFSMFCTQLDDLALNIDPKQVSTENLGADSAKSIQDVIKTQYGDIESGIFVLGYLISLLPMSFERNEDLHRLFSTIEAHIIRTLSSPVLALVARFHTQLPCEIEDFIDKVQQLKCDLHKAINDSSKC